MKISCAALRGFYYDKAMISEGADCEIEDRDVEILEMALAVKRKSEDKAEKPKRRYQRRDMTAEGS